MMRRLAMAALTMVVAAAACTSFDAAPGSDSTTMDAGDDGHTGVDRDAAAPDADSAAADPPPGDASSACPVGDGPSMRKVMLLGGRTICVDRTEVTTAQYLSFLSRITDLTPLNSTVPPGCTGLAVIALSPAGEPGALPQVNVSFCSAAYYCAAQSKRLCGSAVDGSGIIITDGGANPSLEWALACAHGKSADFYPWGSRDPAPAVTAGCWTKSTSSSASGPRDAGASTACGPGDGLGPYDMIGNVWEWVNVRRDDDGGASYTGQLGGAYDGNTVGNGCQTPTGADATHGDYAAGNALTGFRCCADGS